MPFAGVALSLSEKGPTRLLASLSTAKEIATTIPLPISTKVIPETPPIPEPSYGLPVRLQIPRIRVDAAVVRVGITATGDLEVPTNIGDGGWYQNGPHPGDIGSAVIAGHLNGVEGKPGIFIDLDQLQKGDRLAIIDHLGTTTHFVVRNIRTYNYHDRADEVFNDTSDAHLNLITCAGVWDKTQRRYLKRLVVFADKSSESSASNLEF